MPFDERAYLAQIGAPAAFGEPGYTTLERQWTRPTLEVNGMWGGYQGPGQKTVIPSEAHAKITCRLVPDQRPDDVAARVRAASRGPRAGGHAPVVSRSWITVRARRISATDHFALKAADAALQATYGVRPLVVRMGGTVPIAELFQRHLGSTRSSFRSPPRTRTSTRPTSSSACIACTKDSRRGRAMWQILGEASA